MNSVIILGSAFLGAAAGGGIGWWAGEFLMGDYSIGLGAGLIVGAGLGSLVGAVLAPDT